MKKTAFAATLALMAASCTTDPYTGNQKVSNTAAGAGLGAAAGALGGLVFASANNSGSVATRNAALIGAGIGALTGGGIGAYMDRQEAELRRELQGTGVSVTRNGEQIILNMPSNITFATDQDSVRADFYPVLNSVGIVLRKFNQTLVDVTGHTDSTGSDGYNFELSQRRAMSVANYLAGQGVDGRRFAVAGFGENRPIATNATEAGRAANRRVEIQLRPLTGA